MPRSVVEPPTLVLDAEGRLVDPLAWTPAVAEELARASGLPRLTPAHWKVLSCCREASARDGRAPSLPRLARLAGVSLVELRRLFPIRTGALVARLAGLPAPGPAAAASPPDPSQENQGAHR